MKFVLSRRFAVAVTTAAAFAIGATSASAQSTSLTDIEINEVESNNDAVNGDWIELYNKGGVDVNLAGAILSDSDNSHKLVIPSGTILTAGDWVAFRVDNPAVSGNFGLGSNDSARLFPSTDPSLSGAPADSYSWTAHAATTYGADGDGTDNFQTTAVGTFGDANDFGNPPIGNIAGVKLNEVESNGDATNGDWVELYNTTGAAINVDGAIITDNDPAHQFVVPASTPNLAAGAYVAFRVDNPAVSGNFGLGSADEVKLYAPNDVTLSAVVDQFSWSSHAVITYGRTVAGGGGWASTSASTFAAVNQFATGSVPTLAGVVINEVESHGDDVDGDWVELKNTSGASVDLDNAILSDSDNGHVFRIPASTPNLAAGAVAAFRVDNPALGSAEFGLGDADSARLFKADAVDFAAATAVDTRTWSTRAVRTYGLNGVGSFVATNKGTFAAANDFASAITPDLSDIVLNEIVTTGDTTHGDWVELLNTSGSAIDIGGAIIADDSNDPLHRYTIPANTILAAGDTYVLQTETTAGFGLGKPDAVRFYRAGATVGTSIPVDKHDWEVHPSVVGSSSASFARQLSGAGDWALDGTPSYDAAN